MSWKVLAPKVGKESAECLESYLNALHPTEKSIKINWGNSHFIRNNPNDVFGNKMEAVGRSANKQTFFSLCEDLSVLPVVKTYTGPCFQHIDVYGRNGSGVRYVDKIEDFIPGILTTKEVKGIEFRVYFCYNMPYIIYQKVPLTQDTPNNPIQNSLNGYGYMSANKSTRNIPNLKATLALLTDQVANRLELSYGAVDLIMDKNYKVYILESNAAPVLYNENILEGFAEQFARRYS